MGLDVVELVMGVEETFDVSLADGEMAHVRTVGDLFELLRAKRGAAGEKCLTSMAFYRVRER